VIFVFSVLLNITQFSKFGLAFLYHHQQMDFELTFIWTVKLIYVSKEMETDVDKIRKKSQY